MTTLPCMFLSLVLLVPEKYILSTYSRPNHGAILRAGHRNGTLSTPSNMALPARWRGIVILGSKSERVFWKDVVSWLLGFVFGFVVARLWRPSRRSSAIRCSLLSRHSPSSSPSEIILALGSTKLAGDMAYLEDDEYEIPLRDQRYFGAGIKRKRVQFVPSSSSSISTAAQNPSLPSNPTSSAASRYLDVVLKGQKVTEVPANRISASSDHETHGDASISAHHVGEDLGTTDAVCEICNRAITSDEVAASHDSSITHQICLQHSHPPSHVDRRRKGLQLLSSQGWDPDSRLGLGAAGEGILHPIKAVENPEKAGLGLKSEDLARKAVKGKPVKLDAGKIKALESERRRKGEKLREQFYRSEDVEKYLGGDGEQNGSLDMRAFKQVRKNGLR